MSTRYRYRSPRRWRRRGWQPTRGRLVLPGPMAIIVSTPDEPSPLAELYGGYLREHLHLYHPDPINFIPLIPS